MGGGMACARIAGMLATLEQAGLTKYFDTIGGASGGAIIAANAIAGQVEKNAPLYPEALSKPEFRGCSS
jgi:predicted acylesterase/phospholipase RssA